MLHDLFIGFAFLAMIGAPAMVATLGGKKEYQPEPEASVTPRLRKAGIVPADVIRPHSSAFMASAELAAGRFSAPPTLPVRARGMLNR